MLDLVGKAERVLDVGCGEGRFARMLETRGAKVVALDPILRLLSQARSLSLQTSLVRGVGGSLPFADRSFDAAISYLTLIDIPDFRDAIEEMARVLVPGGRLVIANINSFVSAVPDGWVRDEDGRKLYYPLDNYLEERGDVVAWKGISILNYHRPLSAYMDALLSSGLELRKYLEPDALPGSSDENYYRAPWAMAMLWEKPR